MYFHGPFHLCLVILDFHNNDNHFFKIIYFPHVISLTSGPRLLFCPGPPVLNCKPSSVRSRVFFLPIHFVMVLRETVYFVCWVLDGPLLESQTATWVSHGVGLVIQGFPTTIQFHLTFSCCHVCVPCLLTMIWYFLQMGQIYFLLSIICKVLHIYLK